MPDLLWRPERPVTHRLEYSTDIITAKDGTEQRIARLLRPRQVLEYVYRFDTDAEVRKWRTYLFRNMNDVWRVPKWWDRETTTAAVASGSSTWPCDTTLSDIAPNDLVYIESPVDAPVGIVRTVSAVNPSDIVTTATAGAAFPVGTHIYPLVDCKLRDNPSTLRDRVGPETLSLTLDLVNRPDIGGQGGTVSTFQAADDGAARSLLNRVPLSMSPIEYATYSGLERVDFGRGFVQETARDRSVFAERRSYYIGSRTELQFWEAFFELVVGMREPLYTPSYRKDLLISSQPSAGSTPPWARIDVTDESNDVTDTFDYPGQWWTSAAYKNLRFKTNTGEVYRKVTVATDNQDGTITLEVSPAFAASTTISEVSFLERVRIASDVITFEHDGVQSYVDIAIQSVGG